MKRVFILVGADMPDDLELAHDLRARLEAAAMRDDQARNVSTEVIDRHNLLPVYDTLKKATRS